jgi:CRP-like cAMP-binding protein
MISPEQLRRYPYFADVGEESLKILPLICDEVHVLAGHTVFREGDAAENLYIIVEGEVDLQYTLGSGELRTVDTLVAGELMVWSALVAPYRCTATGTVRKNAKLIAMNGEKLRQLCDQDRDLGCRILTAVAKLLANRLENARVQLATID